LDALGHLVLQIEDVAETIEPAAVLELAVGVVTEEVVRRGSPVQRLDE
jgi:hypothetical protein